MKIALCSIPFLLLVCDVQAIIESTFSKQTICDVETRVEKSCSIVTPSVRSLMECLVLCNHQRTCVGASMMDTMRCYLHRTCLETPDCDAVSAEHEYFSKNCLNGGVWNPEKKYCNCVDGWVGERCDELAKSCDDLIDNGYTTNTYKVTLDLSYKDLPNVEVLCNIESTPPAYSTITLMKNSGRSSFNHDWDKYRQGFEMSDPHVWVGLDTWHTLSNAGYNELAVKSCFYISGQVQFDWIYHNFQLSGPQNKFAFTFDSVSNETSGSDSGYRMGDCLGELQNVSFSVWDMDGDSEPFDNCAQNIGSGWWYTDCNATCNLLGWGQGYKEFVPAERRIHMEGIDMDAIGDKLLSIEMYVKTPHINY